MNTIDYLNEALANNYNIDLSSSVFVELTKRKPSITIWIDNNIVHITSTGDYNCYSYYNKSIIKVCEVSDFEKIISIYNSTCGFKSNEEKINSLKEVFSKQLCITK